MAIDATTESNFRDYEEQVNKLDSDDIRVPNQSLILDYFCIDHELTDFLRDEVFLESSMRHSTWKKVNQKPGNESQKINDDEISLLLDSGKSFSSKIWTDIVRLTACKQENEDVVDYIIRARNHERPANVGFEQCSEDPVREFEAETIRRNVENDNYNTRSQAHSNFNSHSHAQQPQRNSIPAAINNNGLLMLVGSLSLLGILAIAVSTSNHETASTSQDNTSSVPTASDTPEAVQQLNNLEAQQRGAVLMCEHQPIIDKVKSLSLVEPQNIKRRDALIASSDKQMRFLNQKSAKGYKYWEDPSCTWGEQWFDKHADNQFRLFLAVSRKCQTPKVHYQYSKDESGNNVLSTGVYNANANSIGEIRLPYPQEEAYIRVEKVTCS